MKSFALLVALSLLSILELNAQACNQYISDDRIIGRTHLLRSEQTTLVVRGNYSYSISLSSDDKGITAQMESAGGVEFNQDDEVIFMDANRTRRSYRFVGMGEMNRQGGIPVQTNVLQLDVTALEWFAAKSITTIYLKNNISNEMRKFTLTSNRLNAFNAMAACFYSVLDPSKVVDKGEAGLLIPSSTSGARTDSAAEAAATSGGSSPAQNRQAAAPTTDEEVTNLSRDLTETKERLRAEIADERRKADQIKSNLQEEVAAAREQAAQQKKQYADEVLAARQQSQEAIKEAQAASAEVVANARDRASE
ncbi:MAG: hypothetical protein AAGJ93_05565, partial [Bacteroidota bacterium]